MISRKNSLALVGLAWVALLACSCTKSNRPPLGRVSGTITYKGQPLEKASISFLPEKQGVAAGLGNTDEKGRYTLTTFEPGDGAPLGQHRIAVALRGPAPVPKGPAKGAAFLEELEEQGKPLIPLKYFDPAKSGLTAEVKKGTNTIDFQLTD